MGPLPYYHVFVLEVFVYTVLSQEVLFSKLKGLMSETSKLSDTVFII